MNKNIIYDVKSPINNSLNNCENKGDAGSFSLISSISCVNKEGKSMTIDSKELNNAAEFYVNYNYWNSQTMFMSTNNLDNSYFKRIVDMGVDAVPYILKEIKIKPSQLVHALDLIFPGIVEYKGFVSLNDACKTWISILSRIGVH